MRSQATPATPLMAASDPPRLDFDDVYGAYAEFVWRNARRLGVPDSELDDVVQDVFLVVLRKLDELVSPGSTRAWLFSILVRTVRSHRRTTQRRDPAVRSGATTVDPDRIPESQRSRPDAQAERSHALRVLCELLDGLDSDKRCVFILAELEEMTIAEIAEALDLNANTVYSRLRAARLDFERAAARQRARDSWRTP